MSFNDQSLFSFPSFLEFLAKSIKGYLEIFLPLLRPFGLSYTVDPPKFIGFDDDLYRDLYRDLLKCMTMGKVNGWKDEILREMKNDPGPCPDQVTQQIWEGSRPVVSDIRGVPAFMRTSAALSILEVTVSHQRWVRSFCSWCIAWSTSNVPYKEIPLSVGGRVAFDSRSVEDHRLRLSAQIHTAHRSLAAIRQIEASTFVVDQHRTEEWYRVALQKSRTAYWHDRKLRENKIDKRKKEWIRDYPLWTPW